MLVIFVEFYHRSNNRETLN